MPKSVDTWKRIIVGKNSHQIAKAMIEDLIGYRKTSLKRCDDEDNVTNMIEALRTVLE